MIRIEEERSEELKREGVTKFAHSLLAANIVDDYKSALEFAGSIGTFADSPLDIETEGKEVKASLSVEGGKLQVFFNPESFTLSFSNKEGVETYEAYSPVVEVQLQHSFLLFKRQDGGSIRAVKEERKASLYAGGYKTINIEHFDFVPDMI